MGVRELCTTTALIAVTGLLLVAGGAGIASAQVAGCSTTQQLYTGCERPSWSVAPEAGSLTGQPSVNLRPLTPPGGLTSRFAPGAGVYRPPVAPVVQPDVPPTRGARDILNRQNPARAFTPIYPMAPLAPTLPGGERR